MTADRTTNELEFQGSVLSWFNIELSRRPALGLELATQETSKVDRKRNDLVIWRNRASNDAFFTLELKTPETPITDPTLLQDACKKAQRWNAPFFAVWNMQSAELYRTPDSNQFATPANRLKQFPQLLSVKSVDDWLDQGIRQQLHERALDLLEFAWTSATNQGFHFPIDASVFVDRLAHRISEIRAELQPALTQRVARSKVVRKRLRHIAASQGFLGFVDDLNNAIVGQFCYRLVGQILFYFALRRKQPSLMALEPDRDKPFIEAVRPYWDDVRRFDYEALFEPHELEQIVPMTEHAEKALYGLISEFNKYDWNTLRDDVLGAIFEQMIPKREQTLLGQFYTPSAVADLLLVLALDGDKPNLLDPGCGSGTFLLRGYQYLHDTQNLNHSELLPLLWGFDLSPFASELAVINLFRQDLAEFNNFPRILSGDFFQRSMGDWVEFPPARGGLQGKVKLTIPQFDAVVANPPYLRSQHQDDLDPKYKNRLYSLVAREHGIEAPAKTDLFAFFVYHAHSHLRIGGRLAFVTSASWLTADYGYFFQRFLLEKFRLIAVIGSEVESFFTQVDQNTVLFVAEKRASNESPTANECIRFVTLKKRLDELLSQSPDHWGECQRLVDTIESVSIHSEDDQIRVRCINAESEIAKLRSRVETRNWSLPLRAPSVYFELIEFDDSPFVPLEQIADCQLGYKSLQNQFFYLDSSTIKTYGIESQFIKPIYQMSDIQSDQFLQQCNPETYLFICELQESDIRGTGALKYIRAMEDIPAAVKKQSGQSLSISAALKKQSGSLWYAPKAIPHDAHVWMRKAFDGTYAPLVFEQGQVVDQRCNYLLPCSKLDYESVAAVLTSSVFALSVEASGSTSMGAGALEMPTTKLSRVMVPDIRRLSNKKRKELIDLAKKVWLNDQPFNWKNSSESPSIYMRQLDEFLLDEFGHTVSVDDIYNGIRQALSARLNLAKEKTKAKKVAETMDISTVAKAIVDSFSPQLTSNRFPESFIPADAMTMPISLDPNAKLEIVSEPFLIKTQIRITSAEDTTLFSATLAQPVAEVLLRSIMLGRRNFVIPTDEEIAHEILTEFWGWLPPLYKSILAECASSSLGTRFENEIIKTTMKMLAWADGIMDRDLYGSFKILPVEVASGLLDV